MRKEDDTKREKKQHYAVLEAAMVKYRDLTEIPVSESGENFSMLSAEGNGLVGQYATLVDMQADFPKIPVRSSVHLKLNRVNEAIQTDFPTRQLVVTYGYRSLEVQTRYFQEQMDLFTQRDIPQGSTIEEEVHRLIAVPSVAGHPTGGAVDVMIVDTETKMPLDFGTAIYDFSTKDAYALSPYISQEAQNNRRLLRDAMMSQGFAPYDGEWWHFSFGDKEWAFYYQQPCAMYEQKRCNDVLRQLKTYR